LIYQTVELDSAAAAAAAVGLCWMRDAGMLVGRRDARMKKFCIRLMYPVSSMFIEL